MILINMTQKYKIQHILRLLRFYKHFEWRKKIIFLSQIMNAMIKTVLIFERICYKFYQDL